MIVAGHNAHLVEIRNPRVPADPVLGTGGTPPAPRWQGDAQAQVISVYEEAVRGGSSETGAQALTTVEHVTVQLPINIPVVPKDNDVLIFQMLNGEQQTLQVRTKSDEYWALGYIKYVCRPTGA